MAIWPAACFSFDMRPLLILGIILIVFGVFVLASEGITYTKTEKVLDLGPIEATTKHRKTIPISPIAGGAAVAAGVALAIVGAKRR
jgi:drug/metabolite transporter (DMT)-like permease